MPPADTPPAARPSTGAASRDAVPAGPASIGLDKMDLVQQYLGVASGGDGRPSYVAVEQAMARRAIADAASDGVRSLRVAVSGYAPSSPGAPNDLALWLSDPGRYWAVMDSMMDELRRRDMKLVATLMFNSLQFPAITGETVGDLVRDPRSRSWQLLDRYVTQFVTRYRGSHRVLLYEMTNELNLSADIDSVAYCRKKANNPSCAVVSDFTSAQLIEFTRRYYALIRSLDPSVPVSTGFSLPRPSAEHLRAQPAFLAGKADWTPDTPAQASANLAAVNRYADVISVHLYPGSRFGTLSSADPRALVAALNREAAAQRKPLFIGEFGQKDPRHLAPGSFLQQMMDAIADERVPYSAVWVWEFYQRSTYQTYNSPPTLFNLEPGYTDAAIESLQRANARLSGRPYAAPAHPEPIVVLTYPLNCQRVASSTVTAYAVASAGGRAASRVEFRLDDGAPVSVAAPPYSASLPLGPGASGPHRLTASAYAADGGVRRYGIVLNPAAGTAGCADGPASAPPMAGEQPAAAASR